MKVTRSDPHGCSSLCWTERFGTLRTRRHDRSSSPAATTTPIRSSVTSFPSPQPTPYRIETARLVLRPWAFEDAEAMVAAVARNREHLAPWLPWVLFGPHDTDQALATIRRFRGQFDLGVDHVFGIFADDDRTVIGGTGLHPRIGPGGLEVGYWVGAEHTRQGFARETTAALTKVGFRAFGARKIEIRVQPENEPSLAIPRQLGYVDSGLLRSVCPTADPRQFHDARVFSMLREELAASPCADARVRAFDGLGRDVPLLVESSDSAAAPAALRGEVRDARPD